LHPIAKADRASEQLLSVEHTDYRVHIESDLGAEPHNGGTAFEAEIMSQ
jgi:hypothetical protein